MFPQAEELSARLATLKKGEEAYQGARQKLLGEVDKWRNRLERLRTDMAELLEAAAMEQVGGGGWRRSGRRERGGRGGPGSGGGWEGMEEEWKHGWGGGQGRAGFGGGRVERVPA
jgi:hypothetical protein